MLKTVSVSYDFVERETKRERSEGGEGERKRREENKIDIFLITL